MTDNEIIKALESCTSETQCLNCPRFRGFLGMSFFTKCDSKLKSDALDLINRQKSQILKEQNKNKKLRNKRNHLKAEIERLTKANKGYAELEQGCYVTGYKNIRAEAVKEFAERLKEKLRDKAKIGFQGQYYYLIGIPFFDNIIEEMVGEG